MSLDFIKSIYYEILSYFVPQKIKYEIIGYCNKCGNCCRNIRAFGLKNEKELKLMQLIFPHYKNFYIIAEDDNKELILSCKHLNKNNECNIYNKRPRLCRNYPSKYIYKNLEMPDACSFSVKNKEFKDYLK